MPIKPSSPSNIKTAPISNTMIETREGIRLGRTCLQTMRGDRAPSATALSMNSFGRMSITSLRTYCIISPQPTKLNAITKGSTPFRMPKARTRIIAKINVGKAAMTSANPRIKRSNQLSFSHPAIAPARNPTRIRAKTTEIAKNNVCCAPERTKLKISRPSMSVPQR